MGNGYQMMASSTLMTNGTRFGWLIFCDLAYCPKDIFIRNQSGRFGICCVEDFFVNQFGCGKKIDRYWGRKFHHYTHRT